MVKNVALLVLFTFFLVYTLVKVNSKIVTKVKNLECFSNTDWINMTCNLKAVSRKKSLINIELELIQEMNKITLHAQCFKRYNTYQPFPINVTFEFCSILGGSDINNIFTPLVRGVMNKYTNLNHTCPYHKGEKLLVKDLDWQPSEFLNMNLPTGEGRYRLDLNYYANGAKTKAFLIIFHADLTEE